MNINNTEQVSDQASDAVRVIKKYPNRRLYDTTTSSYITLAALRRMVMDGEHFVVCDAKTGEEITRAILLQILVEAESGSTPLFATETLTGLIRCYGQAAQQRIGETLASTLRVLVPADVAAAPATATSRQPTRLDPAVAVHYGNSARPPAAVRANA